MIIADIKDEIERLDGVQYTTTHGSKFRVVFQHNADSGVVMRVHKITGCRGELGATQEHLPCVEFEQDDIKKGHRVKELIQEYKETLDLLDK